MAKPKAAKHPSQEDLRITKVAIKADKVVIETEEKHGGETKEGVISSDQAPLPEFQKAFEALGLAMVQVMELPKKYIDSHKLVGVTIGYEKDDGRLTVLCMIWAQLPKFATPAKFKSPHMREHVAGSSSGDAFMPISMSDQLKELISEARRYVEGERAQGTLLKALPAPEDDEEEDKDD